MAADDEIRRKPPEEPEIRSSRVYAEQLEQIETIMRELGGDVRIETDRSTYPSVRAFVGDREPFKRFSMEYRRYQKWDSASGSRVRTTCDDPEGKLETWPAAIKLSAFQLSGSLEVDRSDHGVSAAGATIRLIVERHPRWPSRMVQAMPHWLFLALGVVLGTVFAVAVSTENRAYGVLAILVMLAYAALSVTMLFPSVQPGLKVVRKARNSRFDWVRQDARGIVIGVASTLIAAAVAYMAAQMAA